MEYEQNNIKINGITLPEIIYENNIYYPFSYIYDKVLLKGRQSIKTLKGNGYENEFIQIKINFDFDYKNGGGQNTYCISKEGLIRLLQSSNAGGLTVEQKKGMNSMLNHLGLNLIDEKPRYLDKINYKNNNTYDEFEKDCIEEILKLDNTLKWQICKDCGKYYPLHTNFFSYNTRDNVYSTICKNCLINDKKQHFKHPVYEVKTISEIKSIEKTKSKIQSYDKNYDVIGIYKEYLNSNKNHFPEKIKNKEDYSLILEFLHSKGQINKDELTSEYLMRIHKLKGILGYMSIQDIYKLLYGEEPNEYPWRYKVYNYKSPTDVKIAFKILNNYFKDKNITINDVFNFDYQIHIKNARLGKNYYNSNILDFVMKYYDNKYPAYKFKIKSTNYWKDKENRGRALKYLIEEDMKLEITKIPLYVTITSIRNIGGSTMYTILKNYYSSLYEWVNEVYPDVFDPKDFDINYMRNEFDSEDEQVINDILRNSFDNVLYNPKHNKYTITLVGKIPDWFIFTETGVIIVEYFGLWAKERGMYNSRTRDYIIRSKDKIEKYKSLEGYRFLYIFPEDLDNNFEGLHKKIELIKEN